MIRSINVNISLVHRIYRLYASIYHQSSAVTIRHHSASEQSYCHQQSSDNHRHL